MCICVAGVQADSAEACFSPRAQSEALLISDSFESYMSCVKLSFQVENVLMVEGPTCISDVNPPPQHSLLPSFPSR